jgi:hypothetical protein
MLHVANNYIIFSFFFFFFFLPNILAIPREIQRVRQTESERDREREVLEKESERVLTERDVDVGKAVGKAGHAVVGELAGGARLTESWPVVRV